MSVTTGLPQVIVPVLSSTTASSRDATCRASPERIRMPCSAALPTPVVSDIGVAIPSAQGHAMISVVTATMIAYAIAGLGPKSNQITNPEMARIITAGVK